ncbi:outer membrane-specific lipoprotein transporter subunit LolE [Thalassoglobus neptunius]|uniref:Outer membrane-specific lipoprotein transporter subunit LolE n=1 Tax=Thalassoglobus neptunius TaxID=1938619 RepID=A0A5C5W7U4_9PLAN|nr:ABC transporter permease [Thalassoglobus neptunius]TWT46333.1 outer membrane-specific lipoprotein transporter subunit LolE [Thalassoglobus neptunius]
MNIFHLIWRELKFRRGGFVLGMLAIAVATATFVAAEVILQSDQILTRQLLDEQQASFESSIAQRRQDVEKAGKALEDATRKQMLKLGFNLLILPESQDLDELHLNGTLSAVMPESYVEQLAESSIVTVNHLLPAVTKRIVWPEKDIEVVLHGTRGEVPIMHRAMKKPLLDAVAPGQMVVGHSIHSQLNLKVGDVVKLMGEEFTISQVHPQRGSADDVTVWIDLETAQKLLGMENLIHAILALECECAGDRLAVIREEIAGILPATQVIERYSQAVTRAEARTQAKEMAELALEREEQSAETLLTQLKEARATTEAQHESLTAVVVPTSYLAAASLVALLALMNTFQRQSEIGILRALGATSKQILGVFLGKAFLLGLTGGLLGSAAGLFIGWLLSDLGQTPGTFVKTFADDLGMVLLSGPATAILLAGLASWIAALVALRLDAAVILQKETT